jgi:hypothetical protein
MRNYGLSVVQPDGPRPPAARLEQIMKDVGLVIQEMREKEVWVFNGGLTPASAATVLRPQGSEVLLTDGPFIEGKEHIGGLMILRAPDLDAALEWGRKMARAITLPIEVRAFADEQ